MNRQREVMKDHRPLDDRLDELEDLLDQAFDLVNDQYTDAVNAMLEQDVEAARRVRQRDDEVDRLELLIDDCCERILALHTPVAVDLRRIMMAVKVNTDLERIGDHAKNIAKETRRLASWDGLQEQSGIFALAETVRGEIKGVRTAYRERDPNQARGVIKSDDDANDEYRANIATMIELSQNNPDDAEALVHLISMNKALERIGDHAKNIAESLVFWVEGKEMRHQDLEEDVELERRA